MILKINLQQLLQIGMYHVINVQVLIQKHGLNYLVINKGLKKFRKRLIEEKVDLLKD